MADTAPSGTRTVKLHLPARDLAAWRSQLAHPAGQARREVVPPASPPAPAPAVRWPWYKPVTAVVVGVLIGVVAFMSVHSVERANDTAPSFVPITNATELRTAGDRALALVSYRWHDLGYEIVFAPGERDVRAQTDFVAHRITVFLNRGDAAHRVAHDIGHELGHAYDQRYLTNADRARYLVARSKPNAAWLPGAQLSDYDTGAGDFAEVFASCYAASPEFRSRLAGRPAEACALIPPVPSR